MAHLEARKHISPDSGFPITLHPNFNPKIKSHEPPEPVREEFIPEKDRASFADPEKKALFSAAKRDDLTESIGTVLQDVQLSQLNAQQLDELAALVTERSVVFLRGQDLTTEGQVKLFEHYGVLDRHPAQKVESFDSPITSEVLINRVGCPPRRDPRQSGGPPGDQQVHAVAVW